MRRLLALLLAGYLTLPSTALAGIQNWSTANSIFDGKTLAGAIRPKISPALSGFPIAPDIWGPGGIPKPYDSSSLAKGIGPLNKERNPGYFKGLLGSLFGLLLAPIAFALELVQAVAFTPLRLIKGLAQGDALSLLEPIRTVKNLLLDGAGFTRGFLSLLSGPIWNAFHPEESADFMYANNRLIFIGGPALSVYRWWTNAGDVIATAPSWHTVMMDRREAVSQTHNNSNVFTHEFVHNKQHEKSFWNEHVGEDYKGFSGWNWADAEEYLNW